MITIKIKIGGALLLLAVSALAAEPNYVRNPWNTNAVPEKAVANNSKFTGSTTNTGPTYLTDLATNNILYLDWGGRVQGITLGSGISFSGGVLSATGAGGTLTSVGLAAPSIFTVSGSPVTTSGNLTFTLNTQAANKVWAGPSTGADAVPTFRFLVAADIPSLSYDALNAAHDATNGLGSAAFHAASDFVASSRSLTINGTSGRITSSAGTLDLSADRTWTLDLATAGTAGTYTKITFDAYGRETSGTTLASGDIPNLSSTYELHVAQLTNTVSGTNIDGAPILWGGATNGVVLNNGYQTYVASTGFAFTNLILTRQWATVTVSNILATSVTGTVAIVGLRLLGSSTTNSLILAGGKVAEFSFKVVNGISNHVNLAQQ